MLKLLIEKEIRDIVGSTRFSITFGVCSLLIVLAFYVGGRSYQINLAQYEAAKAENMRKLEGITDWMMVRDFRIFLPPQPLSTLVNGISNDIGRTTEVSGRGELATHDSRYSEDPLFAVFRFLDLEFIFMVVLSLFAIVFGYDAINGEKERGTLRLTFANAMPRATYILGKLGGTLFALALPLLLPMLIGASLFPILGIALSVDEWGRIALVVLTGLLYFGVFLTLSVFVSSITHRSAHSFLLLLVIWIFSVLIVPRSAVLLAGRAVEVPSVDEIASKKSRLNAQLWQEDRAKMSGFKPENTGDPEQMMTSFNKFMQALADERDKKMSELAARLNEERANRENVQRRVAFGLARVSPAASLSLSVSALAGSSLTLKEHYKQAVTAYQKEYARFMLEKTGMNPGSNVIMWRTVEDGGEKPKAIDLKELPAFAYTPLQLAGVLPETLLDMGLLILWNLIFLAAAFAAFLGYDLR